MRRDRHFLGWGGLAVWCVLLLLAAAGCPEKPPGPNDGGESQCSAERPCPAGKTCQEGKCVLESCPSGEVRASTGKCVKPGTVVWTFAGGTHIATHPALDEKQHQLYLAVGGKIYAFDSRTGEKKWSKGLGGAGETSPVILEDGTILVGGSELAQVSFYLFKPDGTLVRDFTNPGATTVTPVITREGRLYYGTSDDKFHAYTIEGKHLWTVDAGGKVTEAAAVGPDGTVYFGSQDKNLYAVSKEGKVKWKFETGDPVTASPVVGPKGTIFVGSTDGIFYAVGTDGNLRQGGYGPLKSHFGGPITASVAIDAAGLLYIGAADGSFVVLDADFAERWRLSGKPGRVASSVALGANGTILATTHAGNLYAIGDKGKILWTYTCGEPGSATAKIDTSPVVASDGTIYVGDWNGTLHAVASDIPGLAQKGWARYRANNANRGW